MPSSTTTKLCSHTDCVRLYYANGYCAMHNYRNRRGLPMDGVIRKGPRPQPLDFAKCGTPSQYRLHMRRDRKPCRACRQAEARRSQDRWARSREKAYA